jgi:hypothetical protein
MRILLIDHNATPFSNIKNKGGIETIVSMQLRLFSLFEEYDVLFYTSNDSEVYSNPKTTTILSSEKSKLNNTNKMLDVNKVRKKELTEIVNKHKPDIILNHNQSNNVIVKFLTEIETPSITYCHNPSLVIGGIAGLSYIETLSNYYKSGGLVVNVGETSMKDWQTYYTKYGEDVCPFNTFQHLPVFFEQPKIQKSEKYGIMATRISKYKRIHTILEFHKRVNKDFTLCYIAPRNEDEKEYFDVIEKSSYDKYKKFQDLPRNEVLDNIAKAEYLVVAGPEAFPVSPIEANLYGVPVVLFSSSDNHPVIEIGKISNLPYAVKRFYTMSKSTDFFNNIEETTFEQRVELSNRIYEYFSPNMAKIRMDKIIEAAKKAKVEKHFTLFSF